jgi:hypothetical protein
MNHLTGSGRLKMMFIQDFVDVPMKGGRIHTKITWKVATAGDQKVFREKQEVLDVDAVLRKHLADNWIHYEQLLTGNSKSQVQGTFMFRSKTPTQPKCCSFHRIP